MSTFSRETPATAPEDTDAPPPVAPERSRWWPAVRERDRLMARIRALRRASKTPDEAPRPLASAPEQDQLRDLGQRVTHLEALVQGLQDSVHRESSRQDKRLAEFEARTQPAALGKALSDDARARGL